MTGPTTFKKKLLTGRLLLLRETWLTVMRPCSPPPGEVAALRRRLLSGTRGLTNIT